MDIVFELPLFVFGIVQVIKQLGLKYVSSSRMLPLWAVVIGAAVNPLYVGSWTAQTILTGAFVGLVTTGLVGGLDKYLKV